MFTTPPALTPTSTPKLSCLKNYLTDMRFHRLAYLGFEFTIHWDDSFLWVVTLNSSFRPISFRQLDFYYDWIVHVLIFKIFVWAIIYFVWNLCIRSIIFDIWIEIKNLVFQDSDPVMYFYPESELKLNISFERCEESLKKLKLKFLPFSSRAFTAIFKKITISTVYKIQIVIHHPSY